jgi:hypothetical protein
MSRSDTTARIVATLAHLAAVRTGPDGAVLYHALYAALLASELHLSPAEADDRAADPAWNEAERAINDRARSMVKQARQAMRAAEHAADAWTPKPGDTVTRTGTDGTWVVRGHEDDDFVWVHRPGVRMVPAFGRVGGGFVDLAPGRPEPAEEELVAVAELRPAGNGQDSTPASADTAELTAGGAL